MRTCTCAAPAFFSSSTIWRMVVPRTMESSTITTRLPRTLSRSGESLMDTALSRPDCVGWMKVLPM